jgi:hypothetical protein
MPCSLNVPKPNSVRSLHHVIQTPVLMRLTHLEKQAMQLSGGPWKPLGWARQRAPVEAIRAHDEFGYRGVRTLAGRSRCPHIWGAQRPETRARAEEFALAQLALRRRVQRHAGHHGSRRFSTNGYPPTVSRKLGSVAPHQAPASAHWTRNPERTQRTCLKGIITVS